MPTPAPDPLDWSRRYPAIAAAVAALSCRSCLIDGEA